MSFLTPTSNKRLRNRHVIHFVDNNGALGALVKGYSSVEDCIKLSSDYWLRAAARRVFLYVDRVESKSNVSDEPSRLKTNGLMHELGAVFDEPNLSYLDSPAPDRDPCRWFGNEASRAQTVASLHAEIYPTSTQPGLA